MMMKADILWGTLFLAPKLASALTAPPPRHCSLASNILDDLPSCHHYGSLEILTSLTRKSSPILVDPIQVDPLLYFPWTHKPYCYQSPTLELCVYTNASFASGRGISIFTTPELAKTFSQLPAFQDATVHTPPTNIPESSIPGSVQPIPSKGLGILASRSIKREELITSYTPLLLVFRESELSTSQREEFLTRAVKQLPEKSRKRYYEMATAYGLKGIETQDRLKANIFGADVGGLEHLAIWPEAARVNHECGPNAQYRIDPDTLVHSIHAVRDIGEGEEITVTYTNPFHSTTERLSSLTSAFHFTCRCPRCTYSADTDQILKEITNLQELLSEWSPPRDGGRAATVADAERLIDIYKSEGLDGFLDVPYGHAALMYSAVGDAEGVVKYARLARKAVGLKEGIGKGDWNFWGKVENDPTGHWSWNRRKA